MRSPAVVSDAPHEISGSVAERRLKIAVVSPYDWSSPGGVNSHVGELAAQFDSWGHAVRIVAPASRPQQVEDDKFIPMGKPVPIPSRGSIGRVSVSVWLRPRITRMLQEEAFDIIHLHEPFSSFVPVAVLGQSGTVNIATFHAYPGSRVYGMGGSHLAKPYFQKLHGLIAVSRPARDYVNERLPGDYEIIPNGISVDRFLNGLGPFPHLQDGMINLLFLGRLEKRKGLRHLLAAFGRLKWDWPNLRLLVVGPGKPDEDSYRIMSERSLQDVVFVGAVSEEDKLRYFKSADIFCSPATGGESQGIVLLEAMASGKPVVATSIPGYSTVMTDGIEGFLVPPKDDAALADAIDSLLRDRGLRSRLAANGRRRVEEFRWERVAKRVMDHYMTRLNNLRPTDLKAPTTPLILF